MKKALITGITGQDGSYLAELLLDKGYEVHGIVRRASSFNTSRLDHLYKDPLVDDTRLFLHYGDMTDGANLNGLISSIRPDEIYNLAAQSHVGVSFQQPEYTANVDALGTLMAVGLMMLPAVAARFWASTIIKLAFYSIIFAFISGYFGLLISYHFNLPSGPTIILVAGFIYIVSVFFGSKDSLMTKYLSRPHFKN